MKMNLAEDLVSMGELFSTHVRKARDIFTMKKFCALTAFTDVLVAWARSSSFMHIKPSWREIPFLIVLLKVGQSVSLRLPIDCVAESGTVCIPETSDIDDLGRIVRSPDALHMLTLCNCDCKLLTAALCRGLHWYTLRCIHTSQRCISSR